MSLVAQINSTLEMEDAAQALINAHQGKNKGLSAQDKDLLANTHQKPVFLQKILDLNSARIEHAQKAFLKAAYEANPDMAATPIPKNYCKSRDLTEAFYRRSLNQYVVDAAVGSGVAVEPDMNFLPAVKHAARNR